MTSAVDRIATEPRPPVRAVTLILLLGLAVIPLIGHGCHGGDEDHEPTVVPIRTEEGN